MPARPGYTNVLVNGVSTEMVGSYSDRAATVVAAAGLCRFSGFILAVENIAVTTLISSQVPNRMVPSTRRAL